MKRNILVKCLLVGVVGSAGALADMTVDKSNGVLTVTSDISGTVIVKVIGPNDEVVVNEKYEGSSFSWTPSGADGAYRYDIRVIATTKKIASTYDIQAMAGETSSITSVAKSDYAGGSIEVVNGQLEKDKISVDKVKRSIK